MNKGNVIFYLENFILIFSIIFGLFLFINLIFDFSIKILISVIILGTFGLLYLIKTIKVWNSMELGNWGWFSIFSAIMVIFAIVFGSGSVLNDAKEVWNDYCFEQGLEEECGDKEVCTKDCNDLNKGFYRLGDCGFACVGCWCLDGTDTERIW